MKLVGYSLLLVLAFSANAATYECAESPADAWGRLQYAVAVVTTQQTAKVSLYKRDPRQGASPFQPMIPTFTSPIKVENGMLHIDTMPTHGLNFTLNLSAPKLATMELRWVRGDIELKCK